MLRERFPVEEVSSYNKEADHTAAAADRFPFPHSQKSGLRCKFDGVAAQFHHPLGGSELSFLAPLTAVEGIEGKGTIQPEVDDKDWQQWFFTHWRFWESWAADKDYRMGFLPADTRIPDHTIWCHDASARLALPRVYAEVLHGPTAERH